MSRNHLTSSDRARLAVLLRTEKYNQKQIAKLLGKSSSSICRELKRNKTASGYNARIASCRTAKRRHSANQLHIKLMPGSCLARRITKKLNLYWSPEQIAGRLKLEYEQDSETENISHPTIYKYIKQHKHLTKFLRHPSKYRRHYGTKIREKQRELAKKHWIDERPDVINNRERLGDWEGDTVIGDKSSKARLLTYAERRSGKAIAIKLPGGPGIASQVASATERQFKANTIPKTKRLSITYDNGSEFNKHERIGRNTKMDIYFAHPYHSWERGTNENINGLYRQFFPKKKDLTNVTQNDIDKITKLLNTRPRKRHNYRTPDEVFRDSA